MSGQTFTLSYPWDTNGYKPETVFTLRLGEDAFFLHVTVKEKNPRRVETRPMHFVHTDSCAEWFVQFQPRTCAWYFNFEVNANGAMYASFRKDRAQYRELTAEELETMHIRAAVHEDFWEVSYQVPFALIRAYIPEFTASDGAVGTNGDGGQDLQSGQGRQNGQGWQNGQGREGLSASSMPGKLIRANFYKCGDDTAYPHYGMWRPFQSDKPDFHRPEEFGEIWLVPEEGRS